MKPMNSSRPQRWLATILIATTAGYLMPVCPNVHAASAGDLALNNPVTVSSTETSSFTAQKAVDGDSTTRWSSLYTDGEWISVDLSQIHEFNGVKLNWEAAYGKGYKIQVSTDGNTWKDVFTTNTGDGGFDYITFDPVRAKYVKMQGTSRATNYGYSLYDFEVYQPTNEVSGIQMNQTRLTIKKGEMGQLEALLQPFNTTNNQIKWTTSDESVVKIANESGGKVILEGLKEGTATVTATTEDGSKQTTATVKIAKEVINPFNPNYRAYEPPPSTYKYNEFQLAGSVQFEKNNAQIRSFKNKWTVRVPGQTVKDELELSDVTVTGLPNGLSYDVKKSSNETIDIIVKGSTAVPVQDDTPIQIVVKKSAFGGTKDLDQVPAMIHYGGLEIPSSPQVDWANQEIGMFMHINRHPNGSAIPPSQMTLSKLNTDQWADVAVSLGAKYMVVVIKHMDGFAWWNSQDNVLGIHQTPYKDGKGDVMADLVKSAKERGLKLGFYLSPQDKAFGTGLGGTISDPIKMEKYVDYYVRQLQELTTKYGDIFEIWFDGNLDPRLVERVKETIDRNQPNAIQFQGTYNLVRWVGNEGGSKPFKPWNTVSQAGLDRFMNKEGDVTSDYSDPNGVYWLPNETDTSLHEGGTYEGQWFGGTPKPLNTLVNAFYNSVGEGTNLLLNVTPQTDGMIPDSYVQRAKELGTAISDRVGYPLAITKGEGKSIELDLNGTKEIDHIIAMEDIAFGERVRKYSYEGQKEDGTWIKLADGDAIGHKHIIKINPVTVKKVRLQISESVLTPKISKLYVTRTGIKAIDPTPPTIPSELKAEVKNDTSVTLSWIAASDPETGIKQYDIYRNGIKVAETSGTNYIDNGLTESNEYTYQVSAVNGQGMEGEKSGTVTVRTAEDTIPPTVDKVTSLQNDKISVTFSEPVDPQSAQNTGNYVLNTPISVRSAVLVDDKTVELTLAGPLEELKSYILTISGIKDRAAAPNTIASNTKMTFTSNSSLEQYFHFNENQGNTVVDKVTGHVSVIQGSTPVWVEGKAGKALDFNGKDHSIIIDPIVTRSNFTLSLWINPRSFDDKKMILSQGQQNKSPYQWDWWISKGRMYFQITNELGQDFGLYEFVTPAGSIPLNEWSHVAVTRDGNKYKMFINGEQAAEKVISGFIDQPYNPYQFRIGSRLNENGSTLVNVFDGVLDEIRLYSKPLSNDEVRKLYTSVNVVPSKDPAAVFSGAQSVQAGETFKLNLGLERVKGVYAQDLDLNFDPNVFEFVSAKSLQTGTEILQTVKEPQGKLRFILASQGADQAIDGDAHILELTLRAKDSNQDTSGIIALNQAVLANGLGEETLLPERSARIEITAAGMIEDVNKDGKVSIGDLSIVAVHYGKDQSSIDWQEAKKADVNHDGKVDISDLSMVAKKIIGG
ncbi:discoidin domain-containing protein [Paenibacillus sp. GCM10027629]|uniref:discoidin domain-containing protein n=1 Tax=Paenibacillus sp. GCM10027629 TaxID=3273414 RepID=UPI00364070CE